MNLEIPERPSREDAIRLLPKLAAETMRLQVVLATAPAPITTPHPDWMTTRQAGKYLMRDRSYVTQLARAGLLHPRIGSKGKTYAKAELDTVLAMSDEQIKAAMEGCGER